jgi:hypothetical protein
MRTSGAFGGKKGISRQVCVITARVPLNLAAAQCRGLSELPRQTTLAMYRGAEAGALSIDSLERGRWRLRRTRQALVPTLLASSLRPLTLAPALLHSPRTLVGRDYSWTRRTRALMSSLSPEQARGVAALAQKV